MKTLFPRTMLSCAGMAILVAVLVLCGCGQNHDFQLQNLKVEYQHNPVGLDVVQPRFSWEMKSTERSVKQLAYQIVLAKDAGGKDVVWDSKKIASDQSVGIPYSGSALQPATRYYWRVTVWNEKQEEVSSNEMAYFETGLLRSGWKGAEWIQRDRFFDQAVQEVNYALDMDVTLVRDNFGVIFSAKDESNMYVWGINTYKEDQPVLRRHHFVNGNPVYTDVKLGKYLSKKELIGKKIHFKIEVKDQVIKTYINTKLVDTYTAKDEKFMDGLVGFRAYVGGGSSEEANYEKVYLTHFLDSKISKVDTIRINHSTQIKMVSTNGNFLVLQDSKDGIPQFRKDFKINKKIQSARIYSSALGIYDLFINGQRVGTPQPDGRISYDELKPGWTDYDKTIQYTTYDVTSLLALGNNVIGSEVSKGWWAGGIAHGEYKVNNLGFIAMLKINYTDGTSETIGTDTTWKTAASGPVRNGDIYDGETYDARLESNWTSPQFDASNWKQATINHEFKGELTAFVGPSVQVREHLNRTPTRTVIYEGTKHTGTTYDTINVVSDRKGSDDILLKKGQTLIYDLGQNMAGWIQFTTVGTSGTQLKFRFAEMLNDNGAANRGNDGPGGSILTSNLRNAKATLLYTLKGDANGETFHPSHTFFGFRYCEVSATADVQIKSLMAEVVGSVTQEGGSMETSNPLVNQLYSNVIWGQRSNFLSIPTDCPQRDERLGWMGDAEIFCHAAAYNADVSSFFQKWMRDVRNSQREDGAFADVSPHSWVGYGTAAWAEAGIIVPWTVYLMYDNREIIRENYAAMEKYMQFLANQADTKYKYNGAGTNYGDWLAYDQTESRYISVCYYAYATELMDKMSKALSTASGDQYALRASYYEDLLNKIKMEFRSRYMNADGTLNQDTQTAYLLALKLNLFENENQTVRAIAHLRNKIEVNGNKLSTGFLGTGILNQTLSRFGASDIAYRLLLQRGNPSWLYSVDQGATTIWERWDSYTKENGFNKDGMNSFNHYSYGAVAEWMFRYMAGMDVDENHPAFKHVILQPTPDAIHEHLPASEQVTWVTASYHSYYGMIKSSWTQKKDGRIVYKVSIPANTTATLHLPLIAENDLVTEGNNPVSASKGVKGLGVDTSSLRALYELGSGDYEFEVNPVIPHFSELIDHNINTSSTFIPNQYSSFVFPQEYSAPILSYTVYSSGDVPKYDPSTWTLKGSNDGKTWNDVDVRTDQKFCSRFQAITCVVQHPASYKNYRLDLSTTDTLKLAEVSLYTKNLSEGWTDFKYPRVKFTALSPNTEGNRIYHELVQDPDAYVKYHALKVAQILFYSARDTMNDVQQIDYTLKDYEGISAKSGAVPEIEIEYSTRHIEASAKQSMYKLDFETRGVLYHELTHAYQFEPHGIGTYGSNKTFWACIEGMADAVRAQAGLFDMSTRKPGGNWMDGYRTTGFFIQWLTTKDPDAIRKFHLSVRDLKVWSFDGAIKYVFGAQASIQSMWNEYQNYLLTQK